MEAAMVATRSRMPAVEDAVLPEPKRSKSILPPLTCDGNIAFECRTVCYRGKCTVSCLYSFFNFRHILLDLV